MTISLGTQTGEACLGSELLQFVCAECSRAVQAVLRASHGAPACFWLEKSSEKVRLGLSPELS